MKRALVGIGILGLLAAAAQIVIGLSLPNIHNFSVYETLATINGFLFGFVPLVALIAAILGAVRAAGTNNLLMVFVFIALGVLVPMLFGIGFAFALGTGFSDAPPSATYLRNATIALAIGMYFPIVVFVATLVYGVRSAAQPGKTVVQA